MKKNIVLLFVIFILACEHNEPTLVVHEEQMFVMGTIVNVSIYGETEKKSRQAFQQLHKNFETQHIEWNPQKEGALKHLNDAFLIQTTVPIDADLRTMINTATHLSIQSEGMFNPAIGKLISLWGFAQDGLPAGPPPKDALIQAMLKYNPQMSDLTVNELTVESRNKQLALNFGAFAKGYAVDLAIEYLQSIDIPNAIVNAGGDLRAIGSKGEKPWLIGIRHPREDGVIAGIEIKNDESIFTSGDYERFYDYQGQRYHHILNPHTGYPAKQTTSVTVLHHNAATADAAATALFVAGPNQWQRVAKKMSIDHVMLINKNGTIYLTPKMEKRLKFTNPQALELIVVHD